MQSEQVETLNTVSRSENQVKDPQKSLNAENETTKIETNSTNQQLARNNDKAETKKGDVELQAQNATEKEKDSIISFKTPISETPSSFNNENSDNLFSSPNEDITSSSEEEIDDINNGEISQEKLLSKVNRYKEQISQLKGENKALQTKIVSIEELCQLYQTQKANFQNQIKSLNNKNSQLLNEISKLKAENYNNINNNEALIYIQKENKKLLEENQKITDKYYELKIHARNQQHNSNIEIKEKLFEITRLQSELQKKDDELDNIKKSNDRAVKKLQQEIDRLKISEKDLIDEIQALENKQMADSSKLSDEDDSFASNNNTELKKQNEILKRKNDLIAQNYELERIELQTMLEQKESLIKTLTIKLNSKSTLNAPQSQIGTSKSLELLRTENKQLKERLLMSTGSNFSAFTQSYLNDKFKSKSSKLNLIIFRQFSKINSKLSSVNSKVSLLQYRLKLRKKRKAADTPIKNDIIYNIHYNTPQRPRRFEALI